MKNPTKQSIQILESLLADAPTFDCAHLPTPLQPLKRLSKHLGGANLWIKRDDCTGLATGGNKARKLEYLIGDALAKGADTVITQGAVQSNHVRQTAAAAAMAGLKCYALYERRVASDDRDYAQSGNVFLTQLFGAQISYYAFGTDMESEMAKLAVALQADGMRPYIIPGGGSNAVGALGYVQCVLELVQQSTAMKLSINHLVHATGSTGTQAGLLAGAQALGNPFPILGIGVRLPQTPQEEAVFSRAVETCKYLHELGLPAGDDLPRESVRANCDYVGDGYGIPTDGMREAVNLLARLEGILLDPVYAGKGMAGLIDLVRRGEFPGDDNVIFLHTGGATALFGYRKVFVSENVSALKS